MTSRLNVAFATMTLIMLLKYTHLYPGTNVRVPRTYTCGKMIYIRFQNNLNNFIVGVQTTHDVRMDTQSVSVFAAKTILMIQIF